MFHQGCYVISDFMVIVTIFDLLYLYSAWIGAGTCMSVL